MSIRASDIARWPLPPAVSPQHKVRMCLPYKQAWPVMVVHNTWLHQIQHTYRFDEGIDEVLRHLIYTANNEPKHIKKLIFKTVRCLHCHVGARAGQHPKIGLGTKVVPSSTSTAAATKDDGSSGSDKMLAIHTFHYEWLQRVTEQCNIASIEKTVRIIIDYYQSRVQQQLYEQDNNNSNTNKASSSTRSSTATNEKELEIFGKNRQDDPRFHRVLQQLNNNDNGDNDTNEDGETSGDNDGCTNTTTTDNTDVPPITTTEVVDEDPAACTQEEMANAIKRCQVGRNSKSYSIALHETPEEYEHRRHHEIQIEQSEETKLAREKINKAFMMARHDDDTA